VDEQESPEMKNKCCEELTLAGSKLVADRFKAKFHYAICFEAGRRAALNLSATSFEPASVMEFGRTPASLC